jgi:hypothetical protein
MRIQKKEYRKKKRTSKFDEILIGIELNKEEMNKGKLLSLQY